jgi:perosamine synthetase
MKIKQMEPSFGEEEKIAINKYLDSGGWLTEHDKTKEFENMIAKYTGSKYCSALSNGTVTLVTSLLALGIKPGDEVLVPDYTMGATPMAVSLIGAKPVFVDVEKNTFAVSYNDLKKKITPKTKALLLVPINGRFPYFGEIVIEYCTYSDIPVVEDSAQCLGSFYEGQHLGTFGMIGSFSFSIPKIITTGQGGCLITDDTLLYEKISMIKNFGRTESGSDEYHCVGSNFKFTDLQAVIGIEQMKKLPERIKIKKRNSKLYQDLLQDIKSIEFPETESEATLWLNDILVETPQKRSYLIEELRKKEIQTRTFYPSMHLQDPYRDSSELFPVSADISSRGLWLPSSVKLTEEEIEYVCESIKKVMI